MREFLRHTQNGMGDSQRNDGKGTPPRTFQAKLDLLQADKLAACCAVIDAANCFFLFFISFMFTSQTFVSMRCGLPRSSSWKSENMGLFFAVSVLASWWGVEIGRGGGGS